MTTYTLAIMPNGLLAACAPDSADIRSILAAEEAKIGDKMPDCTIITGCTLTDDPDETDDYDNVVYRDYRGELFATDGAKAKYAVKKN